MRTTFTDQEASLEKLRREELLQKLDIFDTVISHSYLSRLGGCTVVAKTGREDARVTWLRITKIVKDKDIFFPDQLSMLYTALHSCAKNVLLVVEKRKDSTVDLYLGVRDFDGELRQSGETLKGALPGYLPGVVFEPCQGPSERKAEQFVASFSGVASLRDDKKQQFIQGLERLLDSTNPIPMFTAYFVADNVPDSMAEKMVAAFATLHDSMQPLAEMQQTVNESQTDTLSRSLTESLSQSITDTLSQTVTNTQGTSSSVSSSHTAGNSYAENRGRNIFAKMLSDLTGGKTGTSNTRNESDTTQEQHGDNRSLSQASGKSEARGEVKGRSTQDGSSQSTTTGSSRQITYRNRAAKRVIDLLDKQIDRITQGRPFGLWSVATYFVAPTRTTALKLANIYRGIVIGEQSNLQNAAINVWDTDQASRIVSYLSDGTNPRFMYEGINVSAGSVVTSEELALHMSLPQKSVPGILVREEKTFGRNVGAAALADKRHIRLGCVRHLGADEGSQAVCLAVDDMAKHVFVTGSTGSGKSNTVCNLIEGLLVEGVNVMVIEPVKGEYRHVFGPTHGFNVYGTNPDLTRLLKINPFAFPKGVRVDEHVDRLVEIFNVCWPMYAAMPAVLKDSILRAYSACGWDMVSSRNPYGLFPTFADVVAQLREVINSSDYSADTKGDYIGSLETRLRSLTNGLYSQIFTATDAISDKDLFDVNVIVDLSRTGSSETRSLIMGLLVLKLSEYRMCQADGQFNRPLRHVTVLEEAHNLLRRTSKEQSQEGANLTGKSVEMVANAIAELRTYGEGFVIVDQSPTAVDEAAIKNTNTKIIMALPDAEDRRQAGGAIGLDEEQIPEIARLDMGCALVYQNQWNEAVMCHIDRFAPTPTNSYRQEREPARPAWSPSAEVLRYILHPESDGFDMPKLRCEVLMAEVPSWVKYRILRAMDNNEPETLRGPVLYHYARLGHIDRLEQFVAEGPEKAPEIRAIIQSRLGLEDATAQNVLLATLFNLSQHPKIR